jgi:hypothetical protein
MMIDLCSNLSIFTALVSRVDYRIAERPDLSPLSVYIVKLARTFCTLRQAARIRDYICTYQQHLEKKDFDTTRINIPPQ